MNNPRTRIAAISSRKQESAKKLKDMYSLEEIKTHTNYKPLDDPNVDMCQCATTLALPETELYDDVLR